MTGRPRQAQIIAAREPARQPPAAVPGGEGGLLERAFRFFPVRLDLIRPRENNSFGHRVDAVDDAVATLACAKSTHRSRDPLGRRDSNDHMDGESLLLLWALSGSGDISGAASFVSSAPGSSFVGVSVRRRL